jgi:formiminotetrahydrofolate cyclodeaminase
MSNLFIAAAIVFALAGMVFAIALCKAAKGYEKDMEKEMQEYLKKKNKQ